MTPTGRSPGQHHDDVATTPPLRAGHPVASTRAGTPPITRPGLGDQRQRRGCPLWSVAKRTNRQRENARTAQNRNNPGAAWAQSITRYWPGAPPPGGDPMIITAPQRLSTRRPGGGSYAANPISRSAGDRQSAWPISAVEISRSARRPARRPRRSNCEPFGSGFRRNADLVGFVLVDDLLDGAVGSAARSAGPR